MLRRSLISVATAAVALALAAPLAGAAAAPSGAPAPAKPGSSASIKDATGDVWTFNTDSLEWEPVDAWPTADVTGAAGWHWSDSVQAAMKFVDLKKTDIQVFSFQIRTPELTRVGGITILPKKEPKGIHYLETLKGAEVKAKGMTHKVSYKRDIVQISIPRSLLSNPRWVRVAMMNELYSGSDQYADNPQTTEWMSPQQWKKNPGLSPRLYPAEASG